jgi:hypothetical protein
LHHLTFIRTWHLVVGGVANSSQAKTVHPPIKRKEARREGRKERREEGRRRGSIERK